MMLDISSSATFPSFEKYKKEVRLSTRTVLYETDSEIIGAALPLHLLASSVTRPQKNAPYEIWTPDMEPRTSELFMHCKS